MLAAALHSGEPEAAELQLLEECHSALQIVAEAAPLDVGDDALGVKGHVVEVPGQHLLGVARGELEGEQLSFGQQVLPFLPVDVLISVRLLIVISLVY